MQPGAGGKKMNRLKPRWTRSRPTSAGDAEILGLLKEAFVCVSIPVAAFAIAYMTLQAAIRIFQG
jgi:hypothetical protein